MDYSTVLAQRTSEMNTSAIRELFKALATPGMISLAGGVPAPETFPLDMIKQLQGQVLDKHGPAVFQYGITEGFLPLREAVAAHLSQRGIQASANDVCISTGAQSAIDAAARVLIDPGTVVALEAPTFLAAIKAFKTADAAFVEIPMDEEGIVPDQFEQLCEERSARFAYLIPTFQNPSGRTLSAGRRQQLAEIIQRRNMIVLEDDPYFELRYSGEDIAPLKTLAPDNVIYVGSLSKVFSPGMRLGYYVAPGPIADYMTSVRQAIDVHANRYAQAIAAEYISQGCIYDHLPGVRQLYSKRLDTMLAALEKEFSSLPFTWSKPEGGMFVWLEGPEGLDVDRAYQSALARKVAFVPGKFFFADPGKGLATLRLNFTSVTPEKIEQAVALLAETCREVMNS